MRISNPNWGFEEIADMWFLLKFPLAFFCTNHLLISFCCFELSSLKIHSNDFLVYIVMCVQMNCTLLYLFYVEPMLGYETYFVAVIFITGFYTNAKFLKHGVLWHFDEWKFSDITFRCKLFWCDFDVLKLLSLWLQ